MAGQHSLFNKDTFWKRYRQLQSFLRKRLSPEDVEDVIQTVLYRLVKSDQALVTAEWIVPWLYRAVGNESIDLLRKKRPNSFTDEIAAGRHDFYDDALGIMLSDNDRPEDEMLKNLFWEELEATLSELPAEQREVFERTEFEGESFKKISMDTGISVSTLISRKHYAVLKLRSRLGQLRTEILNL